MRFWVRHLRQGVVISVAIPAIVAVHTWLTVPFPSGLPQYVLGAAIVIGSLPLLLLPVHRLVRHRYGRLFFDGWEALGICLVSGFVLLDGGAGSPFVMFYFILLGHAALAYPPTGLAVSGLVCVLAYVAVGLAGDPVSGATLGAGAAAMIAATAVCAWGSWNHVLAYRQIAAYARENEVLASFDGLTACLNRRMFSARLEAACAEAGPDRPVSLVMLDIDHFKVVNDTHGHAAGDEVLMRVGDALLGMSRAGDAAGRLGGDEFALLLRGTGRVEALAAAQRIREQIRAATPYSVTVSLGVAEIDRPAGAADLLEAADRAVYQAKRSGRDRVSLPTSA